jgi:dTDP-6-deoxy-L-talose 4-dehydrogenase (NAD+)
LAAHAATKPANPYGFAKDVLRQQLGLLCSEHPYSLTWARLFYMYGDGQPASSLLPLLQSAVEKGDSEFPMSGGEQLRDYLPVQEVARQLVTYALDSMGHGPVNICSGTPISVRRLVEQWIDENGWDITPRLGVLPYPDYEPLAFWGVPESNASCFCRLRQGEAWGTCQGTGRW